MLIALYHYSAGGYRWYLCVFRNKKRRLFRICVHGTPGGSRTHGLPLRSTKNRLIHAVLRCYAVFLKPLKYKAFRRIPCFSVSPDFVPFFRLFWRPVSKMLADPQRETNTNELRFESKPWFHTITLTDKLYEKDNFTSIRSPSRGCVKKRHVSPVSATEDACRFIFIQR